MAVYIVTFRLGSEFVVSRHKTLKAARKTLGKRPRERAFMYRIYRSV